MSYPGNDPRFHQTAVGPPAFDGGGGGGPAYPPPRRPGWILPALIALIVALLGAGAALAWVVVREDAPSSSTTAAVATETVVEQAPAPQPAATTQPPVTQPPVTRPRVTQPPATEHDGPRSQWYVQLGAFSEYRNAVNFAAEHSGFQVQPGGVVSSPARWVAVRPVSSRSAGESYCSGYGQNECLVKLGSAGHHE